MIMLKELLQRAKWFSTDDFVLPKDPKFAALLLTRSAFTSALRVYTEDQITFVLQNASWQTPAQVFGTKFAEANNEEMWTREVIFKMAEDPWVFAYSLFPQKTFQHFEKEILSIGAQALGESLLHLYPIRRSNLVLAKVEVDNKLYWLRHSIFFWEDEIFSVYEVIMPSFYRKAD